MRFGKENEARVRAVWSYGMWVWASWMMVLLAGCGAHQEPQARSTPAAAKEMFERTVRDFHFPAARAEGAERRRLLAQAADGYARILKECPGQREWAAQALRSLANVRVEQGQTNQAVRLYARVGEEYAERDWEVLQAWKAAADVLKESGRTEEGRVFLRKIVERFDREDAAPIVGLVVKGAKRDLGNH